MDEQQQIKQVWTRFNGNISALMIFAERISMIADEEDRKQVSLSARRIANLFDDDPSVVEKELLEFVYVADELEVEPNFLERPETQIVFEAFRTGEFEKSVQNWLKRFPKKRNKFLELFSSIFEPSAANGIILRRSTFVLLVSLFETLLVDLLNLYFTVNPPSASDYRTISRGSLSDRVKLLSATGVVLDPYEDLKKDVLEIILRRNLIIHHDGVIDQAFIDKTQSKNPEFKIGRRLRIPNMFLLKSIETIYQFGYLIFQECWRCWGGGNKKQADLHFAYTLFSLLRQNHNPIVAQLASRENNFKLARRERQIIIINHAIALREMGLGNESRKLIDTEISKPAALSVDLALRILREEYDSAHLLLVRMAKSGKIKELSADWPLFRPILDDKRFTSYLDRIR
jgi:hypothetical protein